MRNRAPASREIKPRAVIVFGMTDHGQPTSLRFRPWREGEPAEAVLHAQGMQWVPDRPIHLGHPAPDEEE